MGGGYFGPWECWAIGDGGFGCGIVTLGSVGLGRFEMVAEEFVLESEFGFLNGLGSGN